MVTVSMRTVVFTGTSPGVSKSNSRLSQVKSQVVQISDSFKLARTKKTPAQNLQNTSQINIIYINLLLISLFNDATKDFLYSNLHKAFHFIKHCYA